MNLCSTYRAHQQAHRRLSGHRRIPKLPNHEIRIQNQQQDKICSQCRANGVRTEALPTVSGNRRAAGSQARTSDENPRGAVATPELTGPDIEVD